MKWYQPLSEAATRANLVVNGTDGPICEPCIANSAHMKLHEVRKGIRELMLDGSTVADLAACAVCRQRRFVAWRRDRFDRRLRNDRLGRPHRPRP